MSHDDFRFISTNSIDGQYFDDFVPLKISLHPCEYNKLHFSPASPCCPF